MSELSPEERRVLSERWLEACEGNGVSLESFWVAAREYGEENLQNAHDDLGEAEADAFAFKGERDYWKLNYEESQNALKCAEKQRDTLNSENDNLNAELSDLERRADAQEERIKELGYDALTEQKRADDARRELENEDSRWANIYSQAVAKHEKAEDVITVLKKELDHYRNLLAAVETAEKSAEDRAEALEHRITFVERQWKMAADTVKSLMEEEPSAKENARQRERREWDAAYDILTGRCRDGEDERDRAHGVLRELLVWLDDETGLSLNDTVVERARGLLGQTVHTTDDDVDDVEEASPTLKAASERLDEVVVDKTPYWCPWCEKKLSPEPYVGD